MMASRSSLKLCLRCTLPGDSIARIMGLSNQVCQWFALFFTVVLQNYHNGSSESLGSISHFNDLLNIEFFFVADSWNADTQTKHGYPFHVSWLQIRTRNTIRLYSHRPDHTSTAATFSMELWAEPKSPLLGFDLIPDTDISAGRCRPGSVNENVLTRTCVDDVGCDIDDGGPLRIGPFCVFEMPRPTRMRINVGAMPCVILGDDWFTTNSLPSMGKEYAHRFAQQSLRRCLARGARWPRGRRK